MPVPIDTNMIDTESSPIPSPTTSDENSETDRSRPPTPASPNVIRQLSTKSSLSTDAPSSSTATSRSTNSLHSNTSSINNNVQQARRNSRGQTTFQFYVPTSPPAESSHKSSTSKSNNISGSSNNTETDSPNNNWGSNRSGGSIDIEITEMMMTKSSSSDMLKQPNLSKSFNSISRGASYGSGRSSREGVGFSSTNSLLRGIDPPEKELPTNVAAAAAAWQQQQIPAKAGSVNMSTSEESARKARSRLIQLQKHGKHSSSQSTAASASQQHGVQSRHPNRQKTKKKSTKSASVAVDLEDSEDDEDFPLVATDPIESDEDNETPPPNTTSRRTSRSPIGHQQRNNDDPQSYMNNYPMSAPQPHRPTYKIPPQQMMQHLHAGGPNNIRGSRQGSSQGGIEPPPFGSGNNVMHQQHQHQYIPTRKKKTPNQQHQYNPQNKQQQLHRSLPQHMAQSQQQHMSQPQPRRKSDGPFSKQHMMYTDGINLLEKTVSNDQGELTKEEVETLNDGINYLRQLDQHDEMNKSNNAGRSSPVTPSSAQQQYSSARRKKTAPPPPPLPPYNQGQQQHLIPTKLGNQQRSYPQQTKSRSNSLGNEMEKMAISGGKHRGHRPPPPHNKPTSTPTSPTEQQRRSPIITAAAAMDYVMNAGRTTTPGLDYDDDSNESNGDSLNTQESNDTQEFNEEEVAYLKAIMKTDDNDDEHDEGIDNSILIDDSSSSGASEYDTANEEQFERQSSFSIHVEKTNKPSKYAEDKDYGDNNMRTIHHSKSKSIDNLDKLLLEEEEARQRLQQRHNMHSSAPSFHTLRRVAAANKGGSSANNKIDDDHVLRKSSMDPPDDEQSSEGLSPSVLPMRTMNERLYAVEAVIPTPTRMNDPYDTYVDESPDSFDQTMPRLGHNAHDDEGISRSLGPRSARAGGITGVCLDMSDTHQEEYPKPSMMDRMRTESPEESSSSSSSQSSTSIDAHDDHDNDDLNIKNNPQSTLGSDPLSWDEEVNGDDALMLKLCSHLLPIGLNQSLNSLLIENKSMNQWDNEDPDEPGYVVHRLTNAQLISVENAFEKMVNTIECSSVKNVRDGTNSETFERDLEEAELILDQEEKRYESKSGTDPSPPDPSPNKSDNNDMELQFKQRQDEEEEQQQRCDSVPDFPGIYPPGKGKAGEMECFYLPIITKSEKTGFEPTKDLVLKPGSVFANNYLVQSELGSAAFSTAYRCLDLGSEEDEDGYQDEVCLKVIKNTKDYFDQSLDEIKILQLLKDTGRVHENNIVEMKSFFYHREHLVIVTELLRQNLYEFGKSILESRGPLYFTRQRLSFITRQCLVALKFVHELGLMHCDIKPENILLASYSRALVKVIDFGSSSFVTDRQSSYIQSRSYRAPEVILGLPYDGKLDVWSLGCCVAEMYTNEVTFQNDSELSMLSRIEAICGPFPRHMIAKGRNSHRIFTDSGLIYEKIDPDDVDDMDRIEDRSVDDANRSLYDVYQPKMTTMAARLGFDEDFMEQPKLSEDDQKRALFIDFVSSLLTVDPDARPSAAEALNHPWITSSLDLIEDDIKYGPERI